MSESESMAAGEDGKSGEESRGVKRHSDAANVQSANDWENADLGDDDRNSKFMRLMGAKKVRRIIDLSCTETAAEAVWNSFCEEDNERLNAELEGQYRHGMEMKLSGSARRHTGLGFSDPEPPLPSSETPSEAGTDTADCTDVDGDPKFVPPTPPTALEKGSVEAPEKSRKERKDRSDNGAKTSSDGRKPPAMKFVHSSDS